MALAYFFTQNNTLLTNSSIPLVLTVWTDCYQHGSKSSKLFIMVKKKPKFNIILLNSFSITQQLQDNVLFYMKSLGLTYKI